MTQVFRRLKGIEKVALFLYLASIMALVYKARPSSFSLTKF